MSIEKPGGFVVFDPIRKQATTLSSRVGDLALVQAKPTASRLISSSRNSRMDFLQARSSMVGSLGSQQVRYLSVLGLVEGRGRDRKSAVGAETRGTPDRKSQLSKYQCAGNTFAGTTNGSLCAP